MKQIIGNLLDQKGVICHQVNMRRIMGAGLALQIRNKWPEAYEEYRNYCLKKPELGHVIYSIVSRDVIVAHLFGQSDIGTGIMTNYDVYPAMLESVDRYASSINERIYIPYGIGCGIGGGNWKIMLPMIEEYCPEATIVKLDTIPIQCELSEVERSNRGWIGQTLNTPNRNL